MTQDPLIKIAAEIMARGEKVPPDTRTTKELLDAFDAEALMKTAYTVNRRYDETKGEHEIVAFKGGQTIKTTISDENLGYGRSFVLANLLITYDDFFKEPQS